MTSKHPYFLKKINWGFFCFLKLNSSSPTRKEEEGKWKASSRTLSWYVSHPSSLSYCYSISNIIPKGKTRLLAIIPVIALLFFLPLTLHSLHLTGIFAFFISWLANFKLLLFAFGGSPLSFDWSISLLCFAALASLPIKLHKNPSLKNPKKKLKNHLLIIP